ncbi:MAG TPA: SnoaL-like domain-containing protein [Puia sp.]|nr:SnoaL-like domain-containing protein [Puia sp.]
MTTPQIATRLIELCRQGQYETAQKELYAKDVISIEPHATPAFEKETKGLPAILEKGHKFEAMTEKVYGTTASDPLITGNIIAFTLGLDIAMKGTSRSKMEELCVYQVKDGKIISEQFFM